MYLYTSMIFHPGLTKWRNSSAALKVLVHNVDRVIGGWASPWLSVILNYRTFYCLSSFSFFQFSNVNFLISFYFFFYFSIHLFSNGYKVSSPTTEHSIFCPYIHILYLLSCESNMKYLLLVYVIVEKCFKVE